MVQVIAGEDGAPSPVTDQWTKPGQVTGVTVSTPPPTAGQLTVKWNLATTEGVKATGGGYKVQWRTGSENWDPGRQVDVDNGTAETTIIGDGTPDLDTPLGGTLYRVRVIAYNDGGDGDPSGEATGTPLAAQVATPPMVNAGSEQLEVDWDEADGAYRYKVQWEVGSFTSGFTPTEGTNQKTVAGTETSYTITGLTGGTVYVVRVIAENASGTPAAGIADETTGTPEPGMVGTPTVTPGPLQLGRGMGPGYRCHYLQGAVEGSG